MPKFVAPTEWVAPSEFPELKDAKEIAIDLETKDINLISRGPGSAIGDGFIAGISVATDGWKGYYPIAHEGGGNLDRSKVLNWFTALLKNDATKIFHNALYDVCWIRQTLPKVHINGKIVDTMIAAGLVDENKMRYDLNSLCRNYIGEGKNEGALREAAKKLNLDPKSEMYKLPAIYVGDYAEQDAYLTLRLWQALKVELHREDCESIFDLETQLFPCIVDMKMKGVRVSEETAVKHKKTLITMEKKLLSEIHKETGIDVQIMAARSVAKVFDKLELPYPRTAKANEPSFVKNFLQNHPSPVIKKIARAREINKAHSTFIDSILKYAHKGRIHAEINQLRGDGGGTVTGRFSYSNPNLQQIPTRNKDLGPMIRSLFLPEENHQWGCFDYNQQEPRLVVHYASMEKLYKIKDVVQAYKEGTADFHKIVADMAQIPRDQAKTINLGLFYGMGKGKLQAELGVSSDKAEELFTAYHQHVPFIKQLMDAASNRAQDDEGYIRTLLGRRCRFHLWEPTRFGIHKPLTHDKALAEHGPGIKRAYTYKALNKLIQGAAADMTKKAMIDLYKEGIIAHIQIHDELDISVKDDKQVKQIIEIMESAVKLEIPNKVDYAAASNWGLIK